jgi:acetyltransferase-like isoleucine patch superfamily enzyme
MLKKILNKVNYSPNKFMKDNRKYRKFDIGDWTYGDPDVSLGRTHGILRVGKYCSIAPNVEFILVGDHRTDFVTTYPFSVLFVEFQNLKGFPRDRGDINIGNDVWIGYGAKILSGTTIGDGAVIGANAVVTKDVPPYAIVVGNPLEIIRYRFTDDVIGKLLKIQWWNWPHEEVLKSVPLLMNDDISKFIDYAMQILDKK